MKYQSSPTMLTGLSLFAGALMGLGTGVLLAPQSGQRTRQTIKDLVKDTGEQLEEKAVVTKRSMDRFFNRTKAYCRLQRRSRFLREIRFNPSWLNHHSRLRIPWLTRLS